MLRADSVKVGVLVRRVSLKTDSVTVEVLVWRVGIGSQVKHMGEFKKIFKNKYSLAGIFSHFTETVNIR